MTLWTLIGFCINVVISILFYYKMEVCAGGDSDFGKNFPCKKWKFKGVLNKIWRRPYFTEYDIWKIIFWLSIFLWPIWFALGEMTFWMWIGLCVNLAISKISYSKMEVCMEAVDENSGFGKNFPCKKWKLKGILNKITGERPYFTEYHIWMTIFLLSIFHWPLWFTCWELWRMELFMLGVFWIFLVIEDFLWFVFNPYFGLKRFKPEHIWWHTKWIWKAPDFYWQFIPLGAGLIVLSQML